MANDTILGKNDLKMLENSLTSKMKILRKLHTIKEKELKATMLQKLTFLQPVHQCFPQIAQPLVVSPCNGVLGKWQLTCVKYFVRSVMKVWVIRSIWVEPIWLCRAVNNVKKNFISKLSTSKYMSQFIQLMKYWRESNIMYWQIYLHMHIHNILQSKK